MRISDWSSDVCSSDLHGTENAAPLGHIAMAHIGDARRDQAFVELAARRDAKPPVVQPRAAAAFGPIAFVGDGLIDERRGEVAPAAAGLGFMHRDRAREMWDREEEVRGADERFVDEAGSREHTIELQS